MTEQAKFPPHATIDELIDGCEKLLEIENTVSLDEEARKQSGIFFKIQRLLAVETKALVAYSEFELTTEKLRRLYYAGQLPQSVYLKEPLKYPCSTKQEIDNAVKCDPYTIKAKSAADEARQRVKFLEDTLWRVKERGSEIKTMVEWRKYIEAGI